MSDSPRNQILIVDDDLNIRTTVAMLLADERYEVSTAEDGFDALLQLKAKVPELLISDLNMPRMSGFEFLSVIRRRFPQVLVVAMSGAYESAAAIPGGVIADAFYAKGSDTPGTLLRLIANLIRTSASRAIAHATQSAPVWVPRNGKDSRGLPYVVLTCTECLRAFPLNVSSEATTALMETPCIFCLNEVRYIIDFSLSVASPKKRLQALASISGRRAG